MNFCITEYYVVLLITIKMQLMTAIRYFDRLESEMARDQFEDLSRKLVLAFAPRFCQLLRKSSNQRQCVCAALLDEAFQVASGQYFNLLHTITHYLHVSTVNFGLIHKLSRRRRL